MGRILGRRNDPNAEVFQSFILDVRHVHPPSDPFSDPHLSRKQPPLMPGRPPPRTKLPPQGGTLTVSIVEAKDSSKPGSRPLGGLIGGPARCANARVLAEVQEKSKLQYGHRPSDDVESLKLEVKWEPSPGALGITLTAEESKLSVELATVVRGSRPLLIVVTQNRAFRMLTVLTWKGCYGRCWTGTHTRSCNHYNPN